MCNLRDITKEQLLDKFLTLQAVLVGYMLENNIKEIIIHEPEGDGEAEVVLGVLSVIDNNKNALKVTLDFKKDYH